MDISRLVKVNSLLKLSGKPAVGFGRMMIPVASDGVFTDGQLSRLYSSPTGLASDWAVGTAARVYGDRAFSQTSALVPDAIRIGNLTDGPKNVYDIIALSQAINTLYTFRASGEDVVYTTGGTLAANDDVVTGLKTALDLLDIDGLTTSLEGTLGSKTLRLTYDEGVHGYVSTKSSAGIDFGIHGKARLGIAALAVEPTTAIATQLDAILAEKNDFFFVVNPYPGLALSQAIAAWCVTNKKRLIQLDPTSTVASTALSGGTDLASVWKSASVRAAVLYHPEPHQAGDAAWVGGSSPTAPGTETWKFRTLDGVDPTNLTESQLDNITEKNANAYYEAGVLLTGEGTYADGVFIDTDRTEQALDANLKIAAATTMKNAQPQKIPGDGTGIQMLYGAIKKVFDGMTGPGKAFTSYILDLSRAVRVPGTRKITGFEFQAFYSSAAHDVEMSGLIIE